jgi:hypothetical protein
MVVNGFNQLKQYGYSESDIRRIERYLKDKISEDTEFRHEDVEKDAEPEPKEETYIGF